MSSTFLLTLGLLLGLNWLFSRTDMVAIMSPLGYIDTRHEYFVAKLPRLFHITNSPDVLITSSSLMLTPAARADEEMRDGKTNYDPSHHKQIFQYCQAEYLERKLSKALGHPVAVLNGAIAASIMSDQYLLFKNLLSAGIKPKVLVVCAAPRDFLDNYHPDAEKTQTFEVLGDCVDWTKIKSGKFNLKESMELALGRFSGFFRARRDYHELIDRVSVTTFKHPLHLADAKTFRPQDPLMSGLTLPSRSGPKQLPQPIYEKPVNKLADLKMWKDLYLPIDDERMNAQMSRLNDILQLAFDNDVPAVVLDMPMPKENLALLPPSVLLKYEVGLAGAAQKWNAVVWKPSVSVPFVLDDFEDGGHMCGSGGRKLFDYMTMRLSSDNHLCAHISGRRSFIGQK